MPQEENVQSEEKWPKIVIPNTNSNEIIVGNFGKFPVFDKNHATDFAFESTKWQIQDFIFGPFIDMKKIRGCKTRSVDDMLLVEKDDTVTIFDRNCVYGGDDRKLRITDWQNFNKNQRPVITFKPVWDLHASFETVDNELEHQAVEIFKKTGFTCSPEQRLLGFTPGFSIGRLFYSSGFIVKRRERTYSCILLSVGNKKFVQINYELPNRIDISEEEDISKLEDHLNYLQEERKIYYNANYYR